MSFKAAIVTDWLTQLGGAEKVVSAIGDIFPQAPIYTTFYRKEAVKSEFPEGERIRPSVFNKIPFINRRQITLAPFAKSAIESLDLREFNVIFSFSSSVAKNLKKHPGQIHICYIHTPIRYAWQPEEDPRFGKFPQIFQPLISWYLERLKKWDFENAQKVDLFIANSTETASRVKKFYNQDALVLYPPVNFKNFSVCAPAEKKKYFFAFGRFVKYKKFDLLVETFLGLPKYELFLGGDGHERPALEEKVKKSGAKNIKFLGRLTRNELQKYLSEAQALILPQKEDAGIVQLESFASGTPVIAYKSGGVLDVLELNINGVFFEFQTKESLKKTILAFDPQKFEAEKIRKTAKKFSRENFQKNFLNLINQSFPRLYWRIPLPNAFSLMPDPDSDMPKSPE